MRKIVCLIFIIAFISFIIKPFEISASNISDLKKQMEQNEKNIKELKTELNKLNGDKKSTANEIAKLDLEIESLNAEADGIQLEIDVLSVRIEANSIVISQLSTDIDNNNIILEKRLRSSYKRGDLGYLEIILKSKNLVDAITRMDMIQLIIKSDVDLLKEIQDQKVNLETLKVQLEQEKVDMEQAKSKLIEKRKQVESTKSKKEEYMTKLLEDISEMQANEKKMEKENAKFEKLIQKLQLVIEYSGGIMLWPLPTDYRTITSKFGRRIDPITGSYSNHRGIDIRCPYNTEVYAANSGVVIVAEKHWSYGYYVIIDHGGKISSLYSHNTKLLVKAGQKVNKGDAIALSGSTGQSTGPHLHFEVRENGVCVNPDNYLKGKR